ncbi:hypothetical protein [Arthrobacter sp. Leaf337]|uniref:hypothetical protein n=1 Tax=Arthrobacter sp. Leaf337 TaxID=1736342 RepID=UPI0012E1AF06|nr:hypothetical protein [Arthrobacter sp. Leaf337]
MEQKRMKRERGTGIGNKPFLVYIDGAAKHKTDRMADAAQVTLSRMIEAIIDHMPETIAPGTFGDPAKYRTKDHSGDAILTGLISPSRKAKLKRLGKLNGGSTSMAQVMNEFISQTRIDPYGLPDWWIDPASPIYQEALPITGT